MKVYEALARAFAAEGTTAVFNLMGDGNMYWVAALSKIETTTIYNVRHEGPALAMADGWSRQTGKIGVCAVTNGPGIAQIATSMLVASRAQTPLVIFTGDCADDNPQHLDQRRFVEGAETGYVRLESPEDAYDCVRKAFYRARLESRPILLDAPREIQAMECEDPGDYVPSTTLLPAYRVRPEESNLVRAADLLAKSEKPVIIVGRGAITSGAGDAIRRFAQRIGALIATTLVAKGWLGDDPFHAGVSGLFASRSTTELFVEADCVIGIGASLNDYTIESGYLYGDARFIHVESRPGVIMGSGKLADCYLQGDARATIEALDALLAERKIGSRGFRTPETQAALRAEIDPQAFDIDLGTVDPREASTVLDEALPAEMGLAIGLGHFVSFPAMFMKKPRVTTVLTPEFACIGQGFPTAMGAQIALGRPMMLIEGDASMMMQIQELDTMVRYKLPLLVVIMNDEALGAEYHKLRAHGMDASLAEISSPDLAAIARAFGCRGASARTIDGLKEAVQEFLREPGPMLVDLRVSRKIASVPYRRLYFGEVA